MINLYGMEVIVSPLVQDMPKLKFNAAFLGGSTRTIDEFNRWLLERFGTKPIYLMLFNQKIVTNKRGLAALRNAAKEWQLEPAKKNTSSATPDTLLMIRRSSMGLMTILTPASADGPDGPRLQAIVRSECYGQLEKRTKNENHGNTTTNRQQAA